MAVEPSPDRAQLRRPRLFFFLALFGLVVGAFGVQHALTSGSSLLASRDSYLKQVKVRGELLRPLLASTGGDGRDQIESYLLKEADARYGRRNAALPLSAAGLVLSCLLFAGCLRSLRGDPWGPAAWSFAALASVPYQLLSLLLTVVRSQDIRATLGTLSPSATLLLSQLGLETLLAASWALLAIAYFALCYFYLRTRAVRRRFSGG